MAKSKIILIVVLAIIALVVLGFVILPMFGAFTTLGDLQIQFYDENGDPLAWQNDGGSAIDNFDVTISWTVTILGDLQEMVMVDGTLGVMYVDGGDIYGYTAETISEDMSKQDPSGSKTYTYSIVDILSSVDKSDGATYEIQVTGSLKASGYTTDTQDVIESDTWVKTVYFSVTWYGGELTITGDVIF